MSTYFHVSSSANRVSIAEHGLDWSRMGPAQGIAGSTEPEADGVFVTRDGGDLDFILMLNNTGGPVDVWEVRGVDDDELRDNGNGYEYVPRRIPAADVTLARVDVPPRPRPDFAPDSGPRRR